MNASVDDQQDQPDVGAAGTEPLEPLPPDVRLVQRRSPDVEYVDVQGEIVAWNEQDQALHLLDPPTSLVFLLADGTATLGDTVAELCAVHDEERSVIEHSVLSAAAQLASRGLVEVSP